VAKAQTKTPVAKKGGSRKAPTTPPYFKAGMWCCPRCKNLVEIPIKMTAKPSCCNHIGGAIVEMERIGK